MGKKILLLVSLAFLISCSSTKKATHMGSGGTVIINTDPPQDQSTPLVSPVQIKYAGLLRVEPGKIKNIRLYQFIDKWMDTPYKWGGMNENGIDCSAFVQRLLSEVYNIPIPRTSVQQFFTQQVEPFRSKDYLSEGDLVFFRTLENTIISHVGIYLHNRMFVNSSSSKGVSIASLDNPYWKKTFVAAGRVRLP